MCLVSCGSSLTFYNPSGNIRQFPRITQNKCPGEIPAKRTNVPHTKRLLRRASGSVLLWGEIRFNHPLLAENVQTYHSCNGGNDHPVCVVRGVSFATATALNLAVHEGFVLKLQHRVLDCVLAKCIMSKETKACVTHSFLWGKTVICFLLRHWGATNHSSDLSSFLYTKTPANVKNERAHRKNAGFSSIRCTFGPAHESWWASNVCPTTAQTLPSSWIWKPWRYCFNESHMCAQFLRHCHIADSFLKSLWKSLRIEAVFLINVRCMWNHWKCANCLSVAIGINGFYCFTLKGYGFFRLIENQNHRIVMKRKHLKIMDGK